MYNSSWLWLLPLTMLPFANPTSRYASGTLSHRPVRGELDLNNARGLMTSRLQELRELHRLQDQVNRLLQDRSFLDSIKDQFTDEQLRELRDKILQGGGLSRDRTWHRLLQHAGSRNKLGQQQIDFFHRLAESEDRKREVEARLRSAARPNAAGTGPRNNPPSPGAPTLHVSRRPSLPKLSGAEESNGWERIKDKTSAWVAENTGEVAGDVAAALAAYQGSEYSAPFAEMVSRVQNADFSLLDLGDSAGKLAEYVPNLDDWWQGPRGAWADVRSMFQDIRPPSFPSLGDASATPSGEDSSGPMLALVALGLLSLWVWRTVAAANGRREPAGPFSISRVNPAVLSGVATPADLIRVFEQVALFRLGPEAGTCHHRELARRLGEQGDDSEAAQRRQAADLLAWRYEQARYDRNCEALSAEEWTEVRQALSFLAGVTAV